MEARQRLVIPARGRSILAPQASAEEEVEEEEEESERI